MCSGPWTYNETPQPPYPFMKLSVIFYLISIFKCLVNVMCSSTCVPSKGWNQYMSWSCWWLLVYTPFNSATLCKYMSNSNHGGGYGPLPLATLPLDGHHAALLNGWEGEGVKGPLQILNALKKNSSHFTSCDETWVHFACTMQFFGTFTYPLAISHPIYF